MNPGNDWIDQARRLFDVLRAGPVPTPADDATAADGTTAHSSDCRWCPVCQVAAVARGERPEVTAALADVLTATATALRTFAAAGEPQDAAAGGTASGDTGTAASAGPDADDPPAVQRIDIA
jgi:hypothetical protein